MHTQSWQPGTQYNYDDVVEYQGAKYKIIQPHRSQSDWAPTITPALWGRMQDDHCGDHKQEEHHQQQPIQQQPAQKQHEQHQQSHGSDHKNDHHNEPAKPAEEKHWYDMDEDAKHKMKVGGGIAAGAALLAGGLFAYKKHEEHEEEEKVEAWAKGNWLSEAQARLAQYKSNGPSGPASWVLTQGKSIPKGALEVGPENSWMLYICRAAYDGGIQVGKASDAFKEGGVIGYQMKEIHVNQFEVLVGDMRGLRWVPASGRLNVNSLGYRPVEGGRENDGTPLYIAQAPHKGVVHPGKASEKLDGAYIPYDGKEKNVKDYRILCYNN